MTSLDAEVSIPRALTIAGSDYGGGISAYDNLTIRDSTVSNNDSLGAGGGISNGTLPYLSLYHQINVAVMDKDLQGYVMYPAGFWLGVPQMSRQ